MTTLEQFEKDLIQFISEHQYTKEQEAEPIVKPGEDGTQIELHTVDGDYERIVITLNYIP